MASKKSAFKSSASATAQKKKKREQEQRSSEQKNTTQKNTTLSANANGRETQEQRSSAGSSRMSAQQRLRSTISMPTVEARNTAFQAPSTRRGSAGRGNTGGTRRNLSANSSQESQETPDYGQQARERQQYYAQRRAAFEEREAQRTDKSDYILPINLDKGYIDSFLSDVDDYVNGASDRLGGIRPSYQTRNSTYESLTASSEDLRGRSINIRTYLNTHKNELDPSYYEEMLSYLDNIDEYTRSIDRRAKTFNDVSDKTSTDNEFAAQIRDIDYGRQFQTMISSPDQSEIERLRNYANTAWEQGDDRAAMEYEDQINWLSQNTTGGRMWRYEQNNARIEEIQKQIADLDKRYRPDETGVINAAQEQERQNLVNELNNLQTWNRQYERNSEWGIDVTNVARRVDDFNEYSHADSYGDPNLDEIEADRAQVYGIADQEGNVYIDDGSFTNMTPVLDGGPSPSPTTLRDFKDPLGAYLSWSDEQKSQYVQQPNTSYGAVADAGTSGNWDFINDNELAVYYYYLNKDNVESAQAYLRSLDGTLLDRAKNQLAEDIQNASAGELFIRNVISVPQQVVGGAAAFGGAIGNALRGEGFRSGNAGMWQFAAGQTRAETAGRIDDATGNKTLLGISLGDAYQAGMSALDSMLGAKLSGGAYTVFMGMGAAAQKAEEAYLSGASDQEIVSTALIAGALEYLSEKIAWEKLIGTPAAKTKVQAVFRGLEQAGFEGAEEVVSSVGNNIADLLIMGDRSSFETTKRQLLAENPGMSDSDASFEALKLSLGDLWKDFVGGFISGFGMGMADSFLGVYSGEGYKQYRDAYKQAGLSLENSGATDAVIANARVTAQEKTAAQDKQNARDVKRSQGELARSADRAQNQTKRAREVRDAAQRSGIADSNMSNPYAAAAADYFNQKRAQYRANRAAVEVGRTVQLTSDTMDALNLVDADNAKARDVRFFQGLIGISPAQAAQNAATAQAGAQGLDYIADESKRTLAASDDGRTRNKQTGDEITIDGVADVKNGELLLSTKEGDILPANLITYKNADEALVYETIQRMNVSKASAIALSEAYKAGKVSAQEFALGVNQAYNFGRIGVDMDKAISRSESFAANLTQQQRNTAYRMGQIDAQTSFDAQQSAIDTRVANAAKSADVKIGKVIYEFDNSGFRMNEQQRQGVQIAKMVSALTGADVHLFESYERDGKRYYKDASGAEAVAPNGFYSNGSVWVDVNAGNNGQGIVGVTLSHEFTHFIQEWSPEKFKVLGDYVIRRFNESNVNVDELVRAQMEKAKRARGEVLSYDEAYAEVVADSMEQMFTGEKSQALEQLAELKKQDATLWGKIKEWFKRIAKRLNAIRKAYEGVDADNETAAVVRGIDNFVEQASKIFVEGLDEAGKNYLAAGGEQSSQTQENAQQEQKNSDRGSDEKYDTEGVHWALARNVMSLSEARLIWEAVDNITSRDYVYRKTAQGEYIIESEDALFFVRADAHEPYLDRIIRFSDGYWASIGFGKEEIANASNSDLEIREALSFLKEVYGEGFANEYQASDERTDGRKAGRGKRASRGEVHRADGRGKNHAGNETGSESRTVKRYSVREDSEGRKLTEAQQEYFRDSQVRDEDGKLKVVYHGSAAQFTEFSADFMSQHGSAEGQGFYFTDYKPMAQGYEKNGGQLLEGYLDIKKPLSDSDVTLSEAEVKRLIRAIDPTGDDLVLNYDSRGGMGYPSRAWYNRSVEDTLRAVMSTSESDSEILAELANSMGNPGKVLKTTRETLGYDGYIVEGKYDDATVYVAFDSNQFKDVTNLNPTEDADIHYSVRDSAMGDLDDASTYSYENLTSQKDMQVVMLPDVETVRANGRVDNRLVVDAGLENAAREGYTADNGYIFVKNAYTGMEQRITAASIRHGLGGDIKRVLTNARLGSVIGTIVKNAIPVNGLYNTSNVADNTYAMAAYATDSTGHEYVAIVTVEARSNEIRGITAYDVVHSVSGRQKNSSQADTKSQSKNSIKAAVISISDVLEKVNSTYRSVLSDDVLSHFGVERPDGGYYAGRVKFSLRDTSTVDVETVLNENAQLREANEELRKQFKRTVGVQLDQKAIRKMARDLLKQYDSSYSLDTLTDNLSKVFDVVANGGLTWDEASSAVVDMCRKVLEESSSFDTGLYEYDQPVRDYLKNVRLEISDDMRGGIELVADNGAAYRRGLFGIVGVAKKGSGVSIDQIWREASEMFPAYFSEDIVNAEDQAERLYYLAQSLKRSNYFTNVYEQNIDAAAYDMMLQIGAKYLDVPQSKTFADKFAEKLEAAREASRDAIRKKAAELRAQQKTANRTQKRLDAKITQTARMLAQTETLADSYKESLQQTEAELHAQQKTANRTAKMLDAKITQLARVMLAAENRANRYQEQLATERETAKQRIRDIRNENAQEKQRLAEEYRQKNKEKLAELRENYNRNKLTRQISDSIRSIRKLFENGRGMANVKQGMRDTVQATLGAAEVLFSPDVKDSDLILNSQIPVSQDEQALIQRYRTLSRARGNYLDLVDRGIDVDANSKLAAKAQREMLKVTKQLTALGTLDRMRDAIFSQRVDSALEAVADAYALLDTSADGYISSAYDQDVADYLRDLKTYLKGQIIANMDNDQLKALRKGVKMVLHTIREQNAAFVSDRRETVEQRSTDTMDEVTVANPDRQTKNTTLAGIRKALGWDNLKPFYAFERMQSPTLMRLFQNVRAGEDVWVVDVNEARDYFQNLARQYGYFDIDGNKRFTFTDKSGKAFELSIPQMMSLYAYSKRAAAMQHLENGGFVFDDNARVTDQKGKTKKNVAYNIKQAHVIDQSIIQDVVSELRKQNAGYLAFVDQMQSYLSKTMGAKGNEVSMKLYGVEMFGEAFYFPIITPGDNGSKPIVVNDTFKIKNSGFTQALNPNAVGTIVLSDFMDVWAKHINDMAMYHAFTLPLEDMNRVMNYRVRNENGVVTDSVRMRLTNAFTSDAVNYINQFMTDINNGIRNDNRETFVKRMLSGFKKAKVFVNASVVIQQYSAVVRSTDVIDPKYFIGADMQRIGKKWEEVKRFAPIAAVKEMGHFDTGISGSTEEYIKQRSYQGIGENVKAFFTDRAQTEAALSFAPEFADKIAWTQIWSACKRKAADLNPNLSGDALLQKAGEYFTDAIVRTQVYDSTLSKSGLMRSKSAFLNMATAFMAEPTTTLNMLQHSVSDMKRGKPRAALRTIGSVFGSVMLNALLASIVFAGRDDDEDKTYLEKYFAAVTSDFLDGINPLTMAPIVKDAWSLLQGYDVERSDMTLMSDTTSRIKSLVQTLSNLDPKAEGKELEEQNRELRNQAISTATAVANLFGLPFDNIVRDIRALFNTFGNTVPIKDTNGEMIRDSVLSELQNQIPVWNWLNDAESTSDKLYDALRDGNAEYFARLTRGYEKDSQTNSAIQRALKENEGRITEAAKARMEGRINDYKALVRQMVSEYGLAHAGETTVQDNIVKAINAVIRELENKPSDDSYKPTKQLKMDDYVTAMANGREKDANTARETIIQEMVDYDGKTQDKAEESFVSSAVSTARSRYEDGEISEQTAIRIIMDAKNCSKSDARYTMTMWELQRKNPDVSNGRIEKWYNDVKSSGISLAVYNDYAVRMAECKGVDSDGDGKADPNTAKDQKLAVIDSLPISNEQKDFLYRLNNWAESKLYQAPWH